MLRFHRPRLHAWGLVLILFSYGPDAFSQVPAATPSSSAAQTPSVQQLAEQLRALEAMNRDLAGQLERTSRAHDAQMKLLLDRIDNPVRPTDPPEQMVGGSASGDTPVPDYMDGVFAPYPPGYQYSGLGKRGRKPLRASFGPGFLLQTEDEQFGLQIHYESQIEGRMWEQSDQLPANSGFFLPRQRIFFNGNITKWVEYELAINRGLGNINLLNAYLNFHFDDRFEVRIGRFFTPLPYDQYAISNYWLITPERSLFTTNLSLNRQIGAMAWGYLFNKRLDYAAGVFNGSRNSFESLNNGVDFVGYLNARPFQESQTLEFLRSLNFGSSVAVGQQDQNPVPATFRVGAGSPDANIPSTATVPFLIFNPGTVERGNRLLGSVHAAYFYKGLSLISEWQYGYGGYASSARPSSVSLPFSGYYVSSGYFLTGEHVERRTRVKPLRPLLPTGDDQRRGIGAWELAARVSQFRVGESVFTSGFADPTLWSNSAITTEVGANWYLNEYLKVQMFWLQASFGSPVQYRPGQFQKTADMFWLRCQLYF